VSLRSQLYGGEFDWFAVDGHGHVGHFATAGYGPVPVAVLARLDDVHLLDERILQLPVVAEATGHLPGKIDDWLEMARRGLFAYDWKHWHGPCQRAATPNRPIQLADLPTELREMVLIVTWPKVSFPESLSLRPEELCSCE
jgi:hypothetical protein